MRLDQPGWLLHRWRLAGEVVAGTLSCRTAGLRWGSDESADGYLSFAAAARSASTSA